jgi:hypothetical protein
MGRWGAGFAVAASVLAAVTVGIGAWQAGGGGLTAEDSGVTAPDTMADLPEAGTLGQPRLLATGSDYRSDPRRLMAPEGHAGPQAESEQTPGGPAVATDAGDQPFGADLVPPALDRLWSDPTALRQCLGLVTTEVTAAPATVEVIDFAHLDGEPALVIWITAGDLTGWVWAVGPACGTPEAGLDERFHARVS